MKKLIFILMAFIVIGNASFAQDKKMDKAKPASEKAAHKEKKEQAKKDGEAKDHKAGHMKKDGTPDMRYKENKKPKAAGPMKKDGTPDMRHKANKDAAKKADEKKK